MIRAKRKRGPRRLSEQDERFQRRVDIEHDQSVAASQASGMSCPPSRFPALRELLEAAQAKSEQARRMGTSFHYRGRSFPLLHSSFGYVILQHPTTHKNIGSTSFGSAW